MNNYDFEGKDFGLSKESVHLLRSRFNYKTVSYENINKAIIKNGTEIHNAIIVLVLGIPLLSFAVLQGINVVMLFQDPEVHNIHIETIVLPVIPGILGIYMIYIAMKKGPILRIESAKGNERLRLREFYQSGKIEDFKKYLNQQLTHKLSIED